MIQIGNPVRTADTFTFRGFRMLGAGMGQDSVPDLPGQVQAVAVIFETLHHTQALLIVAESLRQQ